MENAIKFKIQSLLDRKDGKVNGPMSPVEFARDMARQQETKFNRLARVWFEEEELLQRREDGGYTGFDHLIIGTQYSNDLFLSLWVDMGIGGMPVAICYMSDREITIPPVYEASNFASKITEPQIREIFEFIFENPDVLAIRDL